MNQQIKIQVGDFNDLDTRYINSLLPLPLIVNFPTRGEAKLDLLFTDLDEYISAGCIRQPPLHTNDPCAIELLSASCIRQQKYKAIDKREITPSTKAALTEELSSHDWSDISRCRTVDEKVRQLQQTVTATYDKHWPLRRVRVTFVLST